MQIISNLSLWWIIPIAIIAVGLAVYLYLKKHSEWNKELSPSKRYTLTILRALTLFLLMTSLLGILFQYQKSKVQKPILAIAIDDSASMLNYKDSQEVKTFFNDFKKTVDNRLAERFAIHYFSASANPEVLEGAPTFVHPSTNLYESLEGIKRRFYGQNLSSIILVSDGNINDGNLPQYAIQDLLQTKVYTIGVGDSTYRPDQLVKHITANDVVLLGNHFLVSAELEATGLPNTESKVELIRGGEVIASKSVKFGDNRVEVASVSFEVEAKNIGYQAFTVKIEHKSNEHTFLNNKRTFYVNVVDGRNKIVLLSDGPHPDLKALERAFERDENSKVESYLLSEWKRDLTDVTLLVVHSPGNIFNADLAKFIGSTNVSKLYLLGTTADERFFKAFGSPIAISPARQFDEVTGALNIDFTPFQMESSWEQALKNWSPLKVRFGSTTIPKGAHVLLHQKVGPVVKKDALIYFTEQQASLGKSKIGVIAGEGIWRWRMGDFAVNKSFDIFDGMMGKIAQYLSVKPNSEQFTVQAPKDVTTIKEAVFTANIYNASFESMTTSKIDFVLTQAEEVVRKLEFSVRDSSYYLNLGKLNAGLYKWNAKTTVDGKILSKSGELLVEANRLEKIDIRANHGLLVDLASVGDGKFASLQQYHSIIDDLFKRDDLSSKAYSSIELKELIELFWIFVVLILLLSTEWFLRRYWGNY